MEARPAAPGRTAAPGAGASPRPPKIAAQGTPSVPWAENKTASPAPAKPCSGFAQQVKELFGKVAEVITGKPTTLAAAKRKRRDETGRAFIFARAVTVKIRRSILRFLYSPSLHDPAEERAYADHVLRTQMHEWTQEEEQAAHEEALHYGSTAGFDPQP